MEKRIFLIVAVYSLISTSSFCQNWIYQQTNPSSALQTGRIITAENNNYVVIGSSLNPDGLRIDHFVIKFDQNGNELWSRIDTSAHGEGYGRPYDIELTDDGYVMDIHSLKIIKIDFEGNLLWDLNKPGDSSKNCLTSDKEGNLYLGYTSISNNFPNTSSSILTKFDHDGNRLWGKSMSIYQNAEHLRSRELFYTNNNTLIYYTLDISFDQGIMIDQQEHFQLIDTSGNDIEYKVYNHAMDPLTFPLSHPIGDESIVLMGVKFQDNLNLEKYDLRLNEKTWEKDALIELDETIGIEVIGDEQIVLLCKTMNHMALRYYNSWGEFCHQDVYEFGASSTPVALDYSNDKIVVLASNQFGKLIVFEVDANYCAPSNVENVVKSKNPFISIHPNPVLSECNIVNNVDENLNIIVNDLKGKTISTFKLNGKESFIYDMQKLPAGVYNFSSFSKSRSSSTSIVKL